jgi:hypothetical protein
MIGFAQIPAGPGTKPTTFNQILAVIDVKRLTA